MSHHNLLAIFTGSEVIKQPKVYCDRTVTERSIQEVR